MASNWIAYNDLAWTEGYLADPAEYAEEVNYYIQLINTAFGAKAKTLLHFGCGAGGHDYYFKKQFAVTQAS